MQKTGYISTAFLVDEVYSVMRYIENKKAARIKT